MLKFVGKNAFSNVFIILITFLSFQIVNSQRTSGNEDVDYFLDLIKTTSQAKKDRLFKAIEKNWKPEYTIMAVETMYFGYNSDIGIKMALLLQKKTGQNFQFDFNKWYDYIWNQDPKLLTEYGYFKSQLHKHIDPKFETYFQGHQKTSLIRFDEIRWGGVEQDGIPPLRYPNMIFASQAKYLNDSDIVFGIDVNGDARAYPKRILAWHEMFVDTVGNTPVVGVYCTLCGTVILYKNTVDGKIHDLGTSGFLYRSNKLMYDKATQSLWSTLEGKPVVGPLVNKNIQLDYLSVVTTTWGAWKERHPKTKVLSLNTGHNRDYREGIAYKDYFSDDKLMFNVPFIDKKLKNKASVLAIKLPEYPNKPLAISVDFLKKHPIYETSIMDTNFIVLTDTSGANRVYYTNDLRFKSYDQNNSIKDISGRHWTVFENRLESTSGDILPRINTFNTFWFGWQAAYPNTKLIK